jgi:hypothetical protein
VEIVEQTPVAPTSPTPDGQPPQPLFNVTAKRKEKQHNIVVEGVPPEEVWFSKDSRDIEKLRCVG